MKNQHTKAFKEWHKKITELNDKINALTSWDSYAERLQMRYDEMLTEDPRYKKK